MSNMYTHYHLHSLAPTQEQTAANLRFLKDAQSNIHALVGALESKITEIDLMNDMAMAEGVYDDDAQGKCYSVIVVVVMYK